MAADRQETTHTLVQQNYEWPVPCVIALKNIAHAKGLNITVCDVYPIIDNDPAEPVTYDICVTTGAKYQKDLKQKFVFGVYIGLKPVDSFDQKSHLNKLREVRTDYLKVLEKNGLKIITDPDLAEVFFAHEYVDMCSAEGELEKQALFVMSFTLKDQPEELSTMNSRA